MDQLYDDFFLQRTFNSSENIQYGKAQIQDILKLVNLSISAQILDIGCGAGRHLMALDDLGFQNLVGIDVSTECILKSQKNLKNQKVKIYQSDLLNFESNDKFDLVLCLGCTLGYSEMTSDLENNFLDKILNLVKNPSYIAFDFLNTDFCKKNYSYESKTWFQSQDEYILDSRKLINQHFQSKRIYVDKGLKFQKEYQDSALTFNLEMIESLLTKNRIEYQILHSGCSFQSRSEDLSSHLLNSVVIRIDY